MVDITKFKWPTNQGNSLCKMEEGRLRTTTGSTSKIPTQERVSKVTNLQDQHLGRTQRTQSNTESHIVPDRGHHPSSHSNVQRFQNNLNSTTRTANLLHTCLKNEITLLMTTTSVPTLRISREDQKSHLSVVKGTCKRVVGIASLK